MISYIKGQLAEIEPDSIVVDVSGIGCHIFIPEQVFSKLPPIGEMVKIYTYLQVREDAMTFFGFLAKDDLHIFKLLLGVSGIGPKGALAILSVMSTDQLRFAILADDAKTLSKAPGIGIKTAKRLILELKDKIHPEEVLAGGREEEALQDSQAGKDSGVKNEAVMALTALGYSSTEAFQALRGIEITEDMEVEQLLKIALKQMARV